MQKTPDEIMRELNEPIPVHYHHGDLEPHMTPLAMVDLEQLHADAIALIKRLDRTIVDQEKLAKKIYGQKVEAEERIKQIEAQNAELSGNIGQLEAVRDAAVRDLETVCNMMNICSMCKYRAESSERCKGCLTSSNWQWRGVQKEE